MRMLAAAMIAVCVLMLAGCSGNKAAEAAVTADLEDMRYVELDPETDAELESMLSDRGKEYFEMFLGKAGEFDYRITDSRDGEDADTVIVTVRITTYDFASEYLKSWSEFLEDPGSVKPAEEGKDKAAADAQEYDSARLYETLFRNLSNVQNKDHVTDVDIRCTKAEDGSWQTDAKRNGALRNAILGGMIDEISSLAGIGE